MAAYIYKNISMTFVCLHVRIRCEVTAKTLIINGMLKLFNSLYTCVCIECIINK